MNQPAAVACIIAGLLCVSPTPRAQPAANPPPALLRAASQPPASGSPAVQAAENARMPGEMTPEKRPVPQILVPLQRKATTDDAAAAAAAASRPSVDDDVARCLAQNGRRERAQCKRLSKDPGPSAEKQG